MAKKSFSSIEALASYITTSCHKDVLDKVSEESIETMREVTKDQVSGWSGDILDSPGEINRTNRSVELAWRDNGDWFSLDKKTYRDHMYAPWALEHGKVWNLSGDTKYKPATTLEETSTEIIEKDSKETYISIMRRKGFDVK